MESVLNNDSAISDYASLTFGQRIEYLIEKNGTSKVWLAEKLDVTRQAFNYMIKHAAKPKFIAELSEIFNANPVWLETGKGNPFDQETNFKIKSNVLKIPIKTVETIGIELSNEQNNYEYINFECENSDSIIAFKIDNDSIFPPFIENTVLVFDKSKTPKNGDFILFITQNEKAVLVRQYILDGKDIYLNPKNPNFKSLINPVIEIIGVLIEARYVL